MWLCEPCALLCAADNCCMHALQSWRAGSHWRCLQLAACAARCQAAQCVRCTNVPGTMQADSHCSVMLQRGLLAGGAGAAMPDCSCPARQAAAAQPSLALGSQWTAWVDVLGPIAGACESPDGWLVNRCLAELSSHLSHPRMVIGSAPVPCRHAWPWCPAGEESGGEARSKIGGQV
jgi:hypothetical protein